MKFTDGNWLMRKAVHPNYAATAFEVRQLDYGLEIHAPTRAIRHRGDTLQGPNLTIRLSSPMEDTICVRITHFEGIYDSGPHFEIREKPTKVETRITADTAFLVSGNLSVLVGRENYGLAFQARGRKLTHVPSRGTGYMTVDGEGAYLHEQLGLGVGEKVYGLGERFTAFVKNGQTVDIWNEDGGTNSEQAYKNIPFYLTSAGYGVFVNHSGRVSFEVATERVSRVQFSVPGEELEYIVIYGPTPKEILDKYTSLTGRPALPPAWSFGLWLSTSFTTEYDEATVTSFIQGMTDRNIPLHVFHFDCFWMRAFHWTDLVWDPAVFPDPPAMLARLRERGLHICVWINPYIAQASDLFEEGKRNGYLIKRLNGEVWQWDQWQPGLAIIDFTNPRAREWFRSHLEKVLDMGVDALKTDFGERIPTDVQYNSGADPMRMHNYYAQMYNETVFETLRAKRGTGDAVVFARSATAGGQRFPVHWGGDCHSDFESMAESLRGGLSLGLCGFGFWSHDIGGFEGLPHPSVYKRWVAFGLLSSHSRLHGSTSYRVPWLYDEEAVDVLRFFTRMKCGLMPYLFGKAIGAHERGTPLMRPMLLEFPEDPTCSVLDRQYMLGDSLLVAPVMSFDNKVEFYVPEGRWTSLIDGEELVGPKWFRQDHGFLSLPLLVKPNTVLASGSVEDRPDYDFAQSPIFEVYALDDGATVSTSVPTLDGGIAGRFGITRHGSSLDVEVDGDIRDWKMMLAGATSIRDGDFAFETTPRGLLVTPKGQAKSISLILDL